MNPLQTGPPSYPALSPKTAIWMEGARPPASSPIPAAGFPSFDRSPSSHSNQGNLHQTTTSHTLRLHIHRSPNTSQGFTNYQISIHIHRSPAFPTAPPATRSVQTSTNTPPPSQSVHTQTNPSPPNTTVPETPTNAPTSPSQSPCSLSQSPGISRIPRPVPDNPFLQGDCDHCWRVLFPSDEFCSRRASFSPDSGAFLPR